MRKQEMNNLAIYMECGGDPTKLQGWNEMSEATRMALQVIVGWVDYKLNPPSIFDMSKVH